LQFDWHFRPGSQVDTGCASLPARQYVSSNSWKIKSLASRDEPTAMTAARRPPALRAGWTTSDS
jgi:hypothetical protein